MVETATRLCKIVYFDEESVTDYIQIMAGGNLKVEERIQDSEKSQTDVRGKAEVSVIGKLMSLITVKAEMAAKAEAALSGTTEEIKNSVLTNTILTDFIALVEEEKQQGNEIVRQFSGYRIYAPKDSFSHMLLITPYLSMLKGGTTIPAGDVSIVMDKMDNAIRAAKGYYEFVGENEQSEKVIFRFNIKAFRNNYRVADLLKMQVCLYAVYVGESKLSQLSAKKEFDIPFAEVRNPDYDDAAEDANQATEDQEKEIGVYDVLLVGVEQHD